MKNHSRGVAVVQIAMVMGKETIAVGIEGTTKAIALCGLAGGSDELESFANAYRLAALWNFMNDLEARSVKVDTSEN